MSEAVQAWVFALLASAGVLWLARRVGLQRVLSLGRDSPEARRARTRKLVEQLCEIWSDRPEAAMHGRGGTLGLHAGDEALVAMTRQLVRSDADAGVAFAALEFEADRINLQRRVVRRTLLVLASAFPLSAVGTLIAQAAAAGAWSEAPSAAPSGSVLLPLLILAAGLGYLTLALLGARWMQRLWDHAEHQVHSDAMLLARGAELIARGANPEGIRSHMAAYVAQTEHAAPARRSARAAA